MCVAIRDRNFSQPVIPNVAEESRGSYLDAARRDSSTLARDDGNWWMPALGKMLVTVGIVIIIIGGLLWSGFGGWIGKLPGDIRIERGHGAFYFPIVTCVVISIVLSLIFSLFRR